MTTITDDQRVYVIQHQLGPVKIGIAKDPESRMREIQVSSPFTLKLRKTGNPTDAREVEAYLHQHFRRYRLSGEWFDLPPEMRDFPIPLHIDDSGNPDVDIPMVEERDISTEWADLFERVFNTFKQTKYLNKSAQEIRLACHRMGEFDTRPGENEEHDDLFDDIDIMDDTPDENKRCTSCGHLFDHSDETCPVCSSQDHADGGRHNRRW